MCAITSPMVSAGIARRFLIGLAAAAALSSAARAEPLGACIWSGLTPVEQTTILAAYRKDMSVGAAALERRAGKLKAKAARCAGRRDVPPDWVQIMAGAEGVQAYAAEALLASRRLDRPALNAAWAAAPANVAACVRATARLAYFPNGLGCVDPAASAWLLKRIGLDRNQQPAAKQALYFFNARAIGDWGEALVAKLAVKPAR